MMCKDNHQANDLNFEDVSQITIGAFLLSVPICFSEESWRMGLTLPFANLLLMIALSIIFLSIYTYFSVFQGQVSFRLHRFFIRVLVAYGVTALVVSLVLTAMNQFPLFSDTLIAIKRLLIVMMPASMGAIVVDGFDKE